MGRKEAADERERTTGMRQSTGAMIAKIVFGTIFLISGVTTDWAAQAEPGASNPYGPMVVSLVVGLGLIAWGLIPWLRAKKKREELARQAQAAAQAEAYRRANEPKLCPACGATTKGERCEYCGTPLK